MEALARIALSDPMVGPAAERARRICTEICAFGSEAAVISRIPGASHCAMEGAIIADIINTELAIPVLEIEVPSLTDSVATSLGTRIRALVETCLSRREQKHPSAHR